MKKLLKNIFLGGLIGVTILMTSYVGVYYIAGQDVFENEILQLTQKGVLQNQLIIAAFYGVLFTVTLSIAINFIRNEDKRKYNPIIGSLIFITSEIIFVISLDYIGQQFSENIKMMIAISQVLWICTYLLVKGIMLPVEQFFINKKIKEKNAQELEKGN